VPGGMALGIFAGGLVAALAGRWISARAGQYLLPIFAGFLTGDVLLEVGTALVNQLWQH